MKVFVDSNVFLRYFMVDHPLQTERAERLFLDARAGAVELVSGPPVLFEVAWSLRRGYGQSREQVFDALEAIAALPGLSVQGEDVFLRALQLGRDHRMEFADAYIAASALATKAQLATFNERDFKDAGVPLKKWGR